MMNNNNHNHWVARPSRRYQKLYFYNLTTGQATWDLPPTSLINEDVAICTACNSTGQNRQNTLPKPQTPAREYMTYNESFTNPSRPYKDETVEQPGTLPTPEKRSSEDKATQTTYLDVSITPSRTIPLTIRFGQIQMANRDPKDVANLNSRDPRLNRSLRKNYIKPFTVKISNIKDSWTAKRSDKITVGPNRLILKPQEENNSEQLNNDDLRFVIQAKRRRVSNICGPSITDTSQMTGTP